MSVAVVVVAVLVLAVCAWQIRRAVTAVGLRPVDRVIRITYIGMIAAIFGFGVLLLPVAGAVASYTLTAALLVGVVILAVCWVKNRADLRAATVRDLALGIPSVPRTIDDGESWVIGVMAFGIFGVIAYALTLPWVYLVRLTSALNALGPNRPLSALPASAGFGDDYWRTPEGWLPFAIAAVAAASFSVLRHLRRRAAIRRHAVLVAGIDSRLAAERSIGYDDGLAAGRTNK